MLIRALLPLLVSLLLPFFGANADAPAFVGEWDTTYGRMVLHADGNKISGTYEYSGGELNDITGVQEGKILTFTYTEPGVSGEGVFTLAEDGQSFKGKWRPDGKEGWESWNGKRMKASPHNFGGVWKTSYGMMRIEQEGKEIRGCYAYNGKSTFTGSANGDVLKLTYREPDGTEGTAQFKLSPDRETFSGTWKAKGNGGGDWTGSRVTPQPGRIWLVILEARWEESLRDQEYSYGEMLRQFFTRVPTVAVRHRFFTGRKDFAKWCEELPYLNEPVVFYVASHGTESGITVETEVLDGEFIGSQLRDAANVKLVHLGACLAMGGSVPEQIRKSSKLDVPVSGYTLTADWAGSAVIDFTYLDLILSRQLSPGEAVRQIQQNVTFAGEQAKPDCVIPPAGLKIVE